MGSLGSDQNLEVSDQRWRWRRRIALTSLTAGLVYPIAAGLAAIIEPDVSATLASIAWPVYTMLMGNIGAYIGTAAWEHIGEKRGR